MQILTKTNQKAYPQAVKLGQQRTINFIKKKGLTGRGGANFLVGVKWETAYREKSEEKYVICNADEGEPGTFKDKFVLLKNPEAVIEGILITAYVIGAKKAYIYLRGEYEYLVKKLNVIIKKVKQKTKAKTDLEIVLGAGAYICGEETAIISSLEGLRGQPKQRPPYPAVKGLFGKPTVINNVETLANVALAFTLDDWNKELRLFSLSGDVNKPGVYELPLGTRLNELMQLGQPRGEVKAIYFGAAGGCLPYFKNLNLNHDAVLKKGCYLGNCALIVVNEQRSILDLAANIATFFKYESCGKCTPCREGTMRITMYLQTISLGKATKKDLQDLQEIGEVVKDTAFCGLGVASTQHLVTALKYFKKEFMQKIK